MQRWPLLMVLALIPTVLLGQATVTSGWASTPAPAVPGVAPGTPLVTTPIVHLGTISPSPVGASNATAGNVAGATNATLSGGPSVGSATTPQVQVQSGTQYGTESPSAATAIANQPSGIATRLTIVDWGAAQFNSVYNVSPPSDVSLGQLARELRQRKAEINARTFTNDDINRLEQQYGPPGGGVSSTAVSAGSATSGVGANTPAASPPPSSVGAGTQAPPPPEPAAPAPAAPPPSQTAPPPQSATPPPPETAAQSEPPAQPPTADQEPAQAQTQPGQTQESLPAAASQMPTVLLLGAGAVLAGVLLRRRNHRRSGIGF